MTEKSKLECVVIFLLIATLILTTTIISTDVVEAGGKYKIIFNANGGKVSKKLKKVTYKKKVGKLPYPTKEGYIFCGWYTKNKGGKLVTSATKYKWKKKKKFYARWVKKDEYITTVFNEINKIRKNRGLRKLRWSKSMAKATKIRAEDLTKSFSHNRPGENNSKSTFELIGKYTKGRYLGENLALGRFSAKGVVNAWMDSSPHKKVIVNSVYQKLTIYVCDKNGRKYIACHFSD